MCLDTVQSGNVQQHELCSLDSLPKPVETTGEGPPSVQALPWSRSTQRRPGAQRWGPLASRGHCTPCTAFPRLQRPEPLCQGSPCSSQSRLGLCKNLEKVRPDTPKRKGLRWLQDDTLHVPSISGCKRDRRDLQSPLKQQVFSLQQHDQPRERNTVAALLLPIS